VVSIIVVAVAPVVLVVPVVGTAPVIVLGRVRAIVVLISAGNWTVEDEDVAAIGPGESSRDVAVRSTTLVGDTKEVRVIVVAGRVTGVPARVVVVAPFPSPIATGDDGYPTTFSAVLCAAKDTTSAEIATAASMRQQK
jgi:hypothetical protein